MTYREPGEVPSGGIVDPGALAAHVEELEARASQEEAAEERRHASRRAAARAKANRRATRVSASRDRGGVLLSIAHQSESKVALWTAGIFSAIGVAATLAGLVAWSGETKLYAILLAMGAGFPLWALAYVLLNRRALHVYATRNGFFVVYRKSPDRPIAMGRIAHLEFDVRNDGGGMKKMTPKYAGRRLLGEAYCDQLTPRDMETLESFAKRAGVGLR